MNDKANKANGNQKQSARPKQKKPGYTDFVVRLRASCQKSDDKAVKKVIKVLKAGFSERPEKEHLKEVTDLIDTWPAQTDLGVQLALTARFGKASGFQGQVHAFLQTKFMRLTDFPVSTRSELHRLETLTEWLTNVLTRKPKVLFYRSPAEDDVHEKDENTKRELLNALIVCILYEKDPQVLRTCAYMLLSERIKSYTSKSKSKLKPDHELYKLLTGIISKARPSQLNRASIIEVTRNELESKLGRTQQQLMEMTEEAVKAEKSVSDLTSKLDNANSEISDRGKTIDSLISELEAEKQKYIALEKHMTDVSAAELAKLKGTIRKRISHEVEELQYCLDREDPNIEMALGRLTNITDFIKSLKETNKDD